MSAALEIITLKGRYFWRGDKRVGGRRLCDHKACQLTDVSQFLVRGVVYQLVNEEWQNDRFDALSDERLSRLQADISLFKELGINTIFACMCRTEALAQ